MFLAQVNMQLPGIYGVAARVQDRVWAARQQLEPIRDDLARLQSVQR